ncbi:dihydropyrimidine dehydrogenase subunit B [Anaerocolumna cellulosilytica]|uniref:Dihydroorotate dehydrogenase B (NAD(+)), catalytic subunit n=1 Tax=Anaerocolumna cellulosilytica TaxID=433286 RepID=A0A6S6QSZ9_9FIRM|nr:NAD-dependent dihydropyrimidine dehydrogenase subunit PreA [Anaerocolumna cellulosilytica]MBB5196405.1 dihydropyrimidine dehydrogenase (NAD+) subunit PreA [Anaerocolumna cellulosilytica]BCJ94473.1 dihydropyrimidine dehydrogenase subunit B [Anaerocolumna cellulosilytica]
MPVNQLYADIFLTQESARCLLCHAPACTSACSEKLDPAGFIRAVRFENKQNSYRHIKTSACESCDAPCEKACIHYDFSIRIREMAQLARTRETKAKEADLSIDFCGIPCENPFFLSSSVVASNYEMCANALRAGWGGIVFKTIGFLQPKEVSPRFDATKKEGTPFVGFRNLEQIAEHALEENLFYLKKLKEDFPTKIIVASIMGQTDEEWTELAKRVTDTGVDMIECNFSCPHMSAHGLGADVGQTPELVKHYTELTKKGTHLPVLAKMTPNIGHMEIPAIAAMEGGADGIAAINTIKSISGLELGKMAPPPHIDGKSAVSGYSGKAVKPIALRFIHDIAKHERLKGVPISGMGGIETWYDAAEFIALGCENIQITTAVMQYGYRIIDDLISGLKNYMAENGYKNLKEFAGSALSNLVNADKLDRDTVVYPVIDKEKCIGCGRCYISCADAGHQAIRYNEETKKTQVLAKDCVGCHLCLLVCPCTAISTGKRVRKPAHMTV